MAVISGCVTYEELDKIQQAGYAVVVKHGVTIADHEEAWVDVQVDCNVVDLLDLEGGGPGTSSWFRAELERVRENANKALSLLHEALPLVENEEYAQEKCPVPDQGDLDLSDRITAFIKELGEDD